MVAYIISGVTVGIAGFILMVRAGSVSTSTGQGLEMNVITALVLGGVPLSGGSRVKMIGALVGSFSVILLRNGLIVLGVNERVIEGIQGLVLLLLVFLTYVKNQDGILKEEEKKNEEGSCTAVGFVHGAFLIWMRKYRDDVRFCSGNDRNNRKLNGRCRRGRRDNQ